MIVWHLLSFSGLFSVLFFSLIPLVLFFLLYSLFSSSFLVLEWNFLFFEGFSFSFPFMFDKMSLIFSLIVLLISLSILVFSVSYMSGDSTLEYFIYMVVFFVLSMNFLIFIPHLLFLLIGWDGLGLTSYLLVIYYQNDKSLSAGMITLMSNRVGDSLFILAICWSFINGFWMPFLGLYSFFLLLFLFVGSMTKSAQIPFSAWLPAAMAAPTPVSSLVHSSTLVTAGVYVLIRFYSSLVVFSSIFYFLFLVGVITCLMAGFSAVYENDLKKVVAFSTLSQLGFMFMGLGLGLPVVSFFHLIIHALFKALLFVCVGTVIHSMSGNQDMRLMGSLWYVMPMSCMCISVSILALCGFPFVAGFYSKDLIIESFVYYNFPLSSCFFMLLSLVLTGAYSIRFMFFSLWGSYKGSSVLLFSDESRLICFSYSVLLSGAVMGGSLFYWVLFPFAGVMVMPMVVKLLTITLLFIVGFLCYFFIDFVFPFYFFMGSIWFLGIFSSSPLVSSFLKLGDLYYSQELSWFELISGKGILSFFSIFSSKMQEGHSFYFSTIFSLFTMVISLLLVFY